MGTPTVLSSNKSAEYGGEDRPHEPDGDDPHASVIEPVGIFDLLPATTCDRLARLAAAGTGAAVAIVSGDDLGNTVIRAAIGIPHGIAVGGHAPPWLALDVVAAEHSAAAPIRDAQDTVIAAIVPLSGSAVANRPHAVLHELAEMASQEAMLRSDLDARTRMEDQLRHNTLHSLHPTDLKHTS